MNLGGHGRKSWQRGAERPAIARRSGSPGEEKDANGLPAPKGKFNLVLRIYAPRKTPPSILDGTWTPPPPVKRVQ